MALQMSSPAFNKIDDFIRNIMQMREIYQPVMLKTLLQHDGLTSDEDITKAIFSYNHRTKKFPQIVAETLCDRKDGYQLVKRNGKMFELLYNDFDNDDERRNLIELCEGMIKTYLAKKGR